MGKIILLGVAVIAIGGLVYLLISGDDTQNVVNVIPEQEKIETTSVLVASRLYTRGERVVTEEVEWIKWPTKSLPENVITKDDTDFFDTLGSARVRTDIAAGELITPAKVVFQGDTSMLAAFLTPGMRAVSMQVNVESGTAGFILPGDKVDVHIYYEDPDDSDVKWFETLFSDIKVLAINEAIRTDVNNIKSSVATVELSPAQVNTFLAAREEGALTLTLRSAFVPETPLDDKQPYTRPQIIRFGS